MCDDFGKLFSFLAVLHIFLLTSFLDQSIKILAMLTLKLLLKSVALFSKVPNANAIRVPAQSEFFFSRQLDETKFDESDIFKFYGSLI